MALVTRFARLFKADMHAVLDQLEAPEAVLRQAIRDMEEAHAETLVSQRRLSAEREQIRAALADLAKAAEARQAELDLCFEADNESLSRTLVRRGLEADQLAVRLRQQGEKLDAGLTEQAERIEDQRRRLESMRQKAALFDIQVESGPGAPNPDFAGGVSEADVELALLRERKRRLAS